MLGRKADETKVEKQAKKKVNVVCTSLFLNNNELRNVVGLRSVLDSVMFHPSKLQWLDLSYNYLETIDEEILNFPNLKTFYFHGNYLSNLEEIEKLSTLPQLMSVTFYGNFIEQIKGYRMYVLGLLYKHYETLKKMDTVLITNKEMDNIIVWNEYINAKKAGKLKKLVPENIKKPPEKEDEEQVKLQ